MQARQSFADIQFLLNDVLNAPAQWRALAPLADTDGELAAQVLDEAAKFVDSAIAPLQRSGDEEGCRFEAGQVHTPRRLSRGLPGLLAGGLARAGLRTRRRRPGPACSARMCAV